MSTFGIERIYRLTCGDSGFSARFLVQPDGDLRIAFGNSMTYVNAPANQLDFSEITSKVSVPTLNTKITYQSESDSNVYWQVTISRGDAEELKRLIASNIVDNVELLKKVLGD